MRRHTLAVLFSLAFAAIAQAQDQTLTRHYDVRDLIILIPDFNDAVDLRVAPTTRPAGLFGKPVAQPEPTREQLVEQLEQSILTVLGSPAQITEPQPGQLAIATTPDRHVRLNTALDAARQARGAQVTVEARFFELTNGGIEKLPQALRQQVHTAVLQDRQAMLLDDAAVAELLSALQAEPDVSLLSAPRLTLFQAQRAYVLVSTQRAYVRALTEVKGANGARAYDPTIDTVSSGLVLDLTTAASDDRSNVAVHVRARMAQLLEMKSVPLPGSKAEENLIIQVPEQRIAEVSRLLSLPAGKTGLLQLPDTSTGAPATDKRAFMLLRATVAVQKHEERQFPLLREKAEQ